MGTRDRKCGMLLEAPSLRWAQLRDTQTTESKSRNPPGPIVPAVEPGEQEQRPRRTSMLRGVVDKPLASHLSSPLLTGLPTVSRPRARRVDTAGLPRTFSGGVKSTPSAGRVHPATAEIIGVHEQFECSPETEAGPTSARSFLFR